MGKNILKRGVDPYADADVTNHRSGQIPFFIDATKWNAGTPVYVPCPYDGRVREFQVVVDTTNSANNCVVSVSIGTETLGTLTVATGATAGTSYRATINDDADDFNQVHSGDVIIIQGDGAPSAGAVSGTIWIDAGEQ